ncbi:flagellar filament capping protein FliD [Pleionea mediterranea]|jgi:flagellar hook-associated protein 2|uniref:Flagellar hook-associated protein 2 n=1 Tax=Pleionea mediterranea TaxID=523701 RepID=A0A316FNB8_9GAMM|nr:flagellar filament capping protein FliD [Pleionea mediterranea]PWK49176.1 flagellar hook-associated protein 2 [Pleionea mediterranea]
MGLITSAGIGSGIDVESIISAMLKAERAPLESSLNRQESKASTTLSALGSLKSSLSSLTDALENLGSSDKFQINEFTSSDEEAITGSANSSASSGTFSVLVDTLAQGSELQSGAFTSSSDTVGSGTLTLTAGSDTFDVTIDAADTLSDIRSKINNAADNFGVNVNLINTGTQTYLVFDSDVTGTGNTLSVTNDNASLDSISTNLVTNQPAGDATIFVDNIQITNSTNTFTDTIQDITFTATKETATAVDVTISKDIETVKENIQTFVDSYNSFISTANSLGKSSELATGDLAGDSTLRMIVSRVRNVVGNSVSGITSGFDTLSSIGIKTLDTGDLNFDTVEFDKISDDAFSDLSELFAGSNGIATQLSDTVEPYTQLNGIINLREQSLNQQLDRIEDKRLNLDYRLEQLEIQLRSKFGAMDALVSQFNFTGNYLAQQLAALPGASKS